MSEVKVYTVQEVAKLLKIHWQTVLSYIKDGKIKAVKIGRGYRITQADIEDFINKNKT